MKRMFVKAGIAALILFPIAVFCARTFLFGLYHVPTGAMETSILAGDRVFADKLSYWLRPPRRGEIIAFNDPTYAYSSATLLNFLQRYASPYVTNWTKRIIGIPGDHIKGMIEEGKPMVYLNGKKLDESAYVNQYPLIRLWQHAPYEKGRSGFRGEIEYRSFVPEIAWDKQPFGKITKELIVRDPNTNEPEHIIMPGVPHPSGIDIFDVTLGDNEYWVMGDNRLGSSDSRSWGVLDGKLIHGRILYRIWSNQKNSWWPRKY